MEPKKIDQVDNFINAAQKFIGTIKEEIDKTDTNDLGKMLILKSKIVGVTDFVQFIFKHKK
jgi:hypothetical protein